MTELIETRIQELKMRLWDFQNRLRFSQFKPVIKAKLEREIKGIRKQIRENRKLLK